jgi:hypothetical protein
MNGVGVQDDRPSSVAYSGKHLDDFFLVLGVELARRVKGNVLELRQIKVVDTVEHGAQLNLAKRRQLKGVYRLVVKHRDSRAKIRVSQSSG